MRFEQARRYDEFASAQRQAAEDLADTLGSVARDFGRAYEIGCGSGLFTKYLLDKFSCRELFLNDLYRTQAMEGVPAQIGDIRTLELPRNLDLVASSSVFQWIDDLDSLFSKIRDSVVPGGYFALTDNQIDEIAGRYFRIRATRSGTSFLRFESLHDLLDSLRQTGVNNVEGPFRLTRKTLAAMEAHFAGDFRLTYRYRTLVGQRLPPPYSNLE